MTLTEFLLARIVEDEIVAEGARCETGEWESYELDRSAFGEDDTADVVEKLKGSRTTVVVVSSPVDSGSVSEFVSVNLHIARWDPARVLAECEAKRRIVKKYLELVAANPEDLHEIGLVTDYLEEDVLQPLAAVYADHPDFNPEWRP